MFRVPVRMAYQKPDGINQTNDSLRGTFASKADWIKNGVLHDILSLPMPPG